MERGVDQQEALSLINARSERGCAAAETDGEGRMEVGEEENTRELLWSNVRAV